MPEESERKERERDGANDGEMKWEEERWYFFSSLSPSKKGVAKIGVNEIKAN